MGKDWDTPDFFPVSDLRGSRKTGWGETNEANGFAQGIQFNSSRRARTAFIDFMTEVMVEVLRVLKPGGHALVWALPRTSHWTAMACEDAGFEMRDRIHHIFFTGFPKSLDVAKAIDTQLGATRAVVGINPAGHANTAPLYGSGKGLRGHASYMGDLITAPATPQAETWDGWGTALKPASEDWWLCRKPLAEKTVAAQVLATGTGALHIDACRVGSRADAPQHRPASPSGVGHDKSCYGTREGSAATYEEGRWPPHLLFSHTPDCTDDACDKTCCPVYELAQQLGTANTLGIVARYFPVFRYAPKASTKERNRGCEALPQQSAGSVTDRRDNSAGLSSPRAGAGRTSGNRNSHPTVKSQQLMSWLIALVTPPGGLVCDPFMGSGSTIVAAITGGYHYIGIEQNPTYFAICVARTQHAFRERAAQLFAQVS